MNLASTHVDLLPLSGVGGYANEPALSLCNDVLQKLMAPPIAPLPGQRPLILDWKWNRAEMNMLVTSPYRQDYLFAGAVLFSLNAGQSAGIDLASANALTISGSTVTIKTLEQYNGAVGDVCYIRGTGSNYDSTFTQNGVTSSFGGNTYTITGISGLTITATLTGTASGISGSAGITDFNWLAGGTMVGLYANTPILPTRHLEAVRDIQPWGYSATPEKVAVIQDLGTGVLKIRFYQVPGSVLWGVNLVYQKSPVIKTALTDTWTPVPDNLGYVIRQGFLAVAYRYLNSPRADVEDQKFEREIRRALGDDDQEATDVHLYPETGLMTYDYLLWPGF